MPDVLPEGEVGEFQGTDGDDEGFYEEDAEMEDADADALQTPARPGATSHGIAPTPLRTPKTPYKTPRTVPRTVKQTARRRAIEDDVEGTVKKKKKPRKSQVDISALTDEQVALAALQSSKVLHLKLRKKYYAEALNFIRQMEDAMDMVEKLLGSTNKAEVLESMEFFRVAYEYQFTKAEVGEKSKICRIC
jgi:condensin complex subunit 1